MARHEYRIYVKMLDGRKLSVKHAAAELGIGIAAMYQRLHKGVSREKLLSKNGEFTGAAGRKPAGKVVELERAMKPRLRIVGGSAVAAAMEGDLTAEEYLDSEGNKGK